MKEAASLSNFRASTSNFVRPPKSDPNEHNGRTTRDTADSAQHTTLTSAAANNNVHAISFHLSDQHPTRSAPVPLSLSFSHLSLLSSSLLIVLCTLRLFSRLSLVRRPFSNFRPSFPRHFSFTMAQFQKPDAVFDDSRPFPKRIFLFDVDGTLTVPRKRITPEMHQFFADLRKKVSEY